MHPLAALAGSPLLLAAQAERPCAERLPLWLPLAPPRRRWLELGLRVIGRWITATGLLMLGWLVRHPQGW
jgi:hypothetical protein